MSGNFEFDADTAETELTHVMGRAAAERDARAAQRPVLDASATGRDFTAIGQRIAAALEQVHREGDGQLARVQDAAELSRRQVRATSAGDSDFAADLDGVLP